MNNKTRICATIMQKELDQIISSSQEAIKLGADLLEIRIDAIRNPDQEILEKIFQELTHPIIATNRIKEEGGYFEGSEKHRIDLLLFAASHAEFVDIELQTKEKYLKKVLETTKSSIISFHDFEKTPSKEHLQEIVKKAKEVGDLAKFAVMPRTMGDTLTVLEIISEFKGVIGISMGELGRYTRVVAPLFGSPITYASVNSAAAPGQLDITSTKNMIQKLSSVE